MADSKGKNKGNFTCQAGIKNSVSLKGKSTATDFFRRPWGACWGGRTYYSPVLLEVSGCQAQKLLPGFRVPTTAGPSAASKSAGSVAGVGALSLAGLEIPESQVSGGWGRNETLCLQQLKLGALTGGRILPGQKLQARATGESTTPELPTPTPGVWFDFLCLQQTVSGSETAEMLESPSIMRKYCGGSFWTLRFFSIFLLQRCYQLLSLWWSLQAAVCCSYPW